VTQEVLRRLEQSMAAREGGEHLLNTPSLLGAARLVGETLREIYQREEPLLQRDYISADATFLLGGQIQGEAPRLITIYPQGNFVEATGASYFQLGETRYGRPILGRVVRPATTLADAQKGILLSFSSVILHNLSVGFPIDLAACPRDARRLSVRRKIDENDPYWQELCRRWDNGLTHLFSLLPPPQW